jgi:hypothetical protein
MTIAWGMTSAWGVTDERLFADVLDCFVPRNDERASDDERVFNYQLIQSCSSYNLVNPDSDKIIQTNTSDKQISSKTKIK